MKKEGYSRPGLFGTMKNYDAMAIKLERADWDSLVV